jgi:hypothetical protein
MLIRRIVLHMHSLSFAAFRVHASSLSAGFRVRWTEYCTTSLRRYTICHIQGQTCKGAPLGQLRKESACARNLLRQQQQALSSAGTCSTTYRVSK